VRIGAIVNGYTEEYLNVEIKGKMKGNYQRASDW
jgi:hypothetical protein